MFLTEDHVKNAVIAKLGKLHYTPTSVKTLREQGVDITAKHINYNRYFLVEVKGESPETARNSRSGREVRFIYSVGQIMTRIRPERDYRYGLAFPASYRTLATSRLHYSLLRQLHIHLFFVDDKLNVEHLVVLSR